jgi:hypothetical protein
VSYINNDRSADTPTAAAMILATMTEFTASRVTVSSLGMWFSQTTKIWSTRWKHRLLLHGSGYASARRHPSPAFVGGIIVMAAVAAHVWHGNRSILTSAVTWRGEIDILMPTTDLADLLAE